MPKGVILISVLNTESQSFNKGIPLLSLINNAFEFKHVNIDCVCVYASQQSTYLYMYIKGR